MARDSAPPAARTPPRGRPPGPVAPACRACGSRDLAPVRGGCTTWQGGSRTSAIFPLPSASIRPTWRGRGGRDEKNGPGSRPQRFSTLRRETCAGPVPPLGRRPVDVEGPHPAWHCARRQGEGAQSAAVPRSRHMPHWCRRQKSSKNRNWSKLSAHNMSKDKLRRVLGEV
jgi:hypothetical protein